MTDDLTARLDTALRRQEQHEDATRPDLDVRAELHARVTRARRGRAASHAAVAAALVGVLGVAGWFGAQRDPAPGPAGTPTPSPTVVPTPTGTTAPSSTPAADDVPVAPPVPVSLPGMPPLLLLDASVLAATGPGWSIALYTNGYGDPTGPDGEPLPTALVVTAPTGELYLASQPEGGAWQQPVRWDGSVDVVLEDAAADEPRAVLDLGTGKVVADGRGLPRGSRYLGQDAADEEIWYDVTSERTRWWLVPRDGAARPVATSEGARYEQALGPDATRVLLARMFDDEGAQVLDLATGGVATSAPAPDGQWCQASGWLDGSHLLAVCADTGGWSDGPRPDARPRLVRMEVGGSRSVVVERDLQDGDTAPESVRPLGDGRLLADLARIDVDEVWCPDRVAVLLPDGTSVPLTGGAGRPESAARGVDLGGYALVIQGGSCGGDAAPTALVLVDLATGARTVTPAGEGPDRRYPVASAVVPPR